MKECLCLSSNSNFQLGNIVSYPLVQQDNDAGKSNFLIIIILRTKQQQWPLFKFLDFLFENEVSGYNSGIFIT